MSSALAIQLEKVSVIYNDGTPNAVLALDNVSLDIDQGEKVVIAGGNGSGKSTLLKAIAGTAPVKSGRVFIQGTDVTNWPSHKRAKLISFVHQDPLLGTCPNLSVHENFALTAGRSWQSLLPYEFHLSHAQLDSIKKTGLPLNDKANTPMGMLSGGQRQALAVCLSLLAEKSICLFDEFTSALDEGVKEAVLLYTLSEADRHSTTMMMIMHDVSSLVLSDYRLVKLEMGRITLEDRYE